MWIATILGFLVLVFGFLFLFAFPFFSITALQGTNKTANVFFTYPVVCFPLIIAKGVLASFPIKRTKQLGSSSRKWDLDSALPVCSKTQDFHQITGQKDHPIFQILALKRSNFQFIVRTINQSRGLAHAHLPKLSSLATGLSAQTPKRAQGNTQL